MPDRFPRSLSGSPHPHHGQYGTGLVFGKFMPPHNGHLALIDFASARCGRLIVAVCTQTWEPLDPGLRVRWVTEILGDRSDIQVVHCREELPYAGAPSEEISRIWGEYFLGTFPDLDAVFTSEAYGDELGREMGIDHVAFDPKRVAVPVSASQIRDCPLRHWHHIPEIVRPHFTTKICLYGPESVGKSTLSAQLADHFETVWVPEVARDLIADSRRCTYKDLTKVAECHAREILNRLPDANRLLFCDTDLLTTQVYSMLLFDRDLEVEPWVREANRMDLYLFLDTDIPYRQDGSRLGGATQPEQRNAFMEALLESGVRHQVISGCGTERLLNAVDAVNRLIAE